MDKSIRHKLMSPYKLMQFHIKKNCLKVFKDNVMKLALIKREYKMKYSDDFMLSILEV